MAGVAGDRREADEGVMAEAVMAVGVQENTTTVAHLVARVVDIAPEGSMEVAEAEAGRAMAGAGGRRDPMAEGRAVMKASRIEELRGLQKR